MKRLVLIGSWLMLATPLLMAAEGWETQRIHRQFYAEGASAGDLDGDGHLDIVCGPLWFRGPDFKASFELESPRQVPVAGYSEHFFSGTFDANADGATDVLVIGFPGKAARLYLNPGTEGHDQHWSMHPIADVVDNESPAIIDFIPGGLPEIVCGRNGQYGYYSVGKDVTQPWDWTPVTRPGACPGRFAHGMGVGDVNADGRLDLLEKERWWEQPKELRAGQPWAEHRWAESYGGGGAQIRVADIDGDGDHDIVTSLNAHAYGLAWFEQSGDAFQRHDIMGQSPDQNAFGIAFSQMHALEFVDMDGDGLRDIVTGKRWYAHGGKDPGGMEEPVLYWFRCVRSEEGVTFEPKLIDRDSGVGTDVLVIDLNKDGRPDIVSCSKRGLSVHLQTD